MPDPALPLIVGACAVDKNNKHAVTMKYQILLKVLPLISLPS
jgi:hypothetical protein